MRTARFPLRTRTRTSPPRATLANGDVALGARPCTEPRSAGKSRRTPPRPPESADRGAAATVIEYPADPRRHFMHEGLRDLPGSSTVLALGCGEAFLAPHLAEYCGRVTVLDSSAVEIAQLSGRFPEVAFRQHDPSSPLPFPAESFDAIWCCDFLDRVFDPASALRELHRVLRPAGRLLIIVPEGTSFPPAGAANDGCAAAPRFHHFSADELLRLVRQGGFKDVDVSVSAVARRSGRSAAASGAASRTRGSSAARPGAGRCLLLKAVKGPSLRLGAAGPRATVAPRPSEAFEDPESASEARPAA